jgi:hypothetical protein
MASLPNMQLLTTNNNKHIEREFDELKNKPVYGWTVKQRQPQYKPAIGLLKKPPVYENAGSRWKKVLEERFEQQSWYGGNNNLNLNNFNGTFHKSRARTKNT